MKINFLPFLFFILILSSCQEQSSFIKDCKCTKFNNSNGITVVDTLNHYSIKLPNQEWNLTRNYDENGNGINAGLFRDDSFQTFGIAELEKFKPWPSKIEAQKDIDSKYDVIDFGTVYILGQEQMWSLVNLEKDEFPSLSLFITIEHPYKGKFYTLNLSASNGKEVKKRLCELEGLIESFTIIE